MEEEGISGKSKSRQRGGLLRWRDRRRDRMAGGQEKTAPDPSKLGTAR